MDNQSDWPSCPRLPHPDPGTLLTQPLSQAKVSLSGSIVHVAVGVIAVGVQGPDETIVTQRRTVLTVIYPGTGDQGAGVHEGEEEVGAERGRVGGEGEDLRATQMDVLWFKAGLDTLRRSLIKICK